MCTCILQCFSGRLEKEDLNAKLTRLGKRIEEIKVEVNDALERKYADFYPNLDATMELNARVEALSDEMQAVSSNIDNEVKKI